MAKGGLIITTPSRADGGGSSAAASPTPPPSESEAAAVAASTATKTTVEGVDGAVDSNQKSRRQHLDAVMTAYLAPLLCIHNKSTSGVSNSRTVGDEGDIGSVGSGGGGGGVGGVTYEDLLSSRRTALDEIAAFTPESAAEGAELRACLEKLHASQVEAYDGFFACSVAPDLVAKLKSGLPLPPTSQVTIMSVSADEKGGEQGGGVGLRSYLDSCVLCAANHLGLPPEGAWTKPSSLLGGGDNDDGGGGGGRKEPTRHDVLGWRVLGSAIRRSVMVPLEDYARTKYIANSRKRARRQLQQQQQQAQKPNTGDGEAGRGEAEHNKDKNGEKQKLSQPVDYTKETVEASSSEATNNSTGANKKGSDAGALPLERPPSSDATKTGVSDAPARDEIGNSAGEHADDEEEDVDVDVVGSSEDEDESEEVDLQTPQQSEDDEEGGGGGGGTGGGTSADDGDHEGEDEETGPDEPVSETTEEEVEEQHAAAASSRIRKGKRQQLPPLMMTARTKRAAARTASVGIAEQAKRRVGGRKGAGAGAISSPSASGRGQGALKRKAAQTHTAGTKRSRGGGGHRNKPNRKLGGGRGGGRGGGGGGRHRRK